MILSHQFNSRIWPTKFLCRKEPASVYGSTFSPFALVKDDCKLEPSQCPWLIHISYWNAARESSRVCYLISERRFGHKFPMTKPSSVPSSLSLPPSIQQTRVFKMISWLMRTNLLFLWLRRNNLKMYLQGRDDFMGRCVESPSVKLKGHGPPAPKLLWEPVTKGTDDAGEILAAFELFLVRHLKRFFRSRSWK